MASIFEASRRKDFNLAFDEYMYDIAKSRMIVKGVEKPIAECIQECFRNWPYRCGKSNTEDYLNDIGVDITDLEIETDKLIVMELYINIFHWMKEFYRTDNLIDFDPFSKDNVYAESIRLIENAEYILEQCCDMMVREESVNPFPRYRVTRRDERVSAAVEDNPSLKNILLGYGDIRNCNDIKYKERALLEIYHHLEPRRKKYQQMACHEVSETFFAAMNQFGIRHNTSSQKIVRNKANLLDDLFGIALYILQTETVIEYKNEIRGLLKAKKC